MLKFQQLAVASVCACIVVSPAMGQGSQGRTAQVVRVEQVPRMDGRLDDAVWRSAPPLTGFTQRDPDEGKPAIENTEIRLAYDDDALYIGARMFSRKPADIRALITRRDNQGASEQIAISLDTYRDRRTAYTFAVTPAGVRLDWYHAGDNEGDTDEDWNPVWETHTRIDSLGWVAEMKIPFAQLRFSAANVQEWGINVVRTVPDRNERSYWVLVRRTEAGWSSRMGALTGIRGVKPSRRMELLPYVAADTRTAAEFDPGDPFNKQYTNRARAGGDLKMGLGPNMTVDLTINPDFGQVEGDPAVVNLSAYETFFDERRPFFLEGSNLLSQRNLFYSRRIGAQPPGSASGDYVERLANTTILGAGKLTGQLRPGLEVAALAAVTDRESVRTFDSTATPQFGSAVVAPRTAYAAVSARQLFGEDASTLSGTLTAVRRGIGDGDALSALLPQSAYSGLIDGRWRWAGGKYDINAAVAFTNVRGDSAAITQLQRSSRRYFQRPDASHVEVDSSAQALSGTYMTVSHSKMAGRHWLWDLDFHQWSPGFEPNDIGAFGAVDNRSLSEQVRWRETKPARWYRRYDVALGSSNNWNFDGMHRQNESFGFFNVTFPNYLRLSGEYSYTARALSDRLTRGGPMMATPATGEWSVEVESRADARNEWSVAFGHGRDENGGWQQSVEVNLGARPGDRWEVSFDPEWSRSRDARQYIQTEALGRPETFFNRYVFGRVALSEISARFRLNYTFTPNLTLETYAQPFAASGRYSTFGELFTPGHRELIVYGTQGTTITAHPDGSNTVTADGNSFDIDNENFNERSLRTNAVLRWEWRPGSTLFVVWQQTRGSERSMADARPQHLLQAFGARADNFVALKVSYWLPVR